MQFNLRIDPRKVTSFKDFGLKDALVKSLPPSVHTPWPIQKKLLSLNTSGINAFVRSPPNQGKSLAITLGLLSTPKLPAPHITNLVLVPTPALADQYKETMEAFGATDSEHFMTLYRTGSIEQDEMQHEVLGTSRSGDKPNTHVHTIIATPQRVLDYLDTCMELVPLDFLRQIVIDELDVFEHSNPEKVTPLEILIEYLIGKRQTGMEKDSASALDEPIFTILTSDRAKFSKLPHFLAQCRRPLYEVNENIREWPGTVIRREVDEPLSSEAICGRIVSKLWQGPGLVLPPTGISPAKMQAHVSHLEGAVVVRAPEIAGLHIENLKNVYMLGDHTEKEINKTKWSMNGEEARLYLINCT